MPLTVVKNGSPIIVTGATDTDTEILPKSGIVHINFIRWYLPTTNAHLAHVTDGEGRTILKMYAAANVSQHIEIDYSYYGIRCDDLDSGELHIYIT